MTDKNTLCCSCNPNEIVQSAKCKSWFSNNSQWIKCTPETMPKNTKLYLIYTNIDGHQVALWDIESKEWHIDLYSDENVTHWQELPDNPEEQK